MNWVFFLILKRPKHSTIFENKIPILLPQNKTFKLGLH